MKLPKYPLEQLMLIKERRLEESEKRLKEKKQILEKELQKLKTLEAEAQLVHDHKQEKIKQLDKEMDQGTDSLQLDIAYKYLKIVQEQLVQKKKKVLEQDKVVKTAEQQVEAARIEMIKKQREVEKLTIHKDEWKKEVMKEIEYKETLNSDEIGSAKYISLKKAKEKKKDQELKKKEKSA
jgi:hypothetical protein